MSVCVVTQVNNYTRSDCDVILSTIVTAVAMLEVYYVAECEILDFRGYQWVSGFKPRKDLSQNDRYFLFLAPEICLQT